ncbi:uncharacterized protein LOC132619685 [Lycium barbarum]|uniref:uncharacterized protein LOC132619685 n=1 Tax=Lycium barbarum TaxID=112863 RepID=UPI00293EB0D0|nr:uncharacterized protein LOC132619685 [Lycium barbarum]
MAIPKQASWMVRKILNMRKYWHTIITSPTLVKKEKFHIQAAYIALRGPVTEVAWSSLICHSVASPRTVFILWLALLGRLRTQDLLIKWGIDVNGTCVLCKNGLETQEHLLFHCYFSKKVWQEMLS